MQVHHSAPVGAARSVLALPASAGDAMRHFIKAVLSGPFYSQVELGRRWDNTRDELVEWMTTCSAVFVDRRSLEDWVRHGLEGLLVELMNDRLLYDWKVVCDATNNFPSDELEGVIVRAQLYMIPMTWTSFIAQGEHPNQRPLTLEVRRGDKS